MPDKGSGQKIDRRVPLEAKTVLDAKRKLEKFNLLEKASNFSIRQSQPFNSFRDQYLIAVANVKKRTNNSEGQHLKTMECLLLQLANLSDQSRRNHQIQNSKNQRRPHRPIAELC